MTKIDKNYKNGLQEDFNFKNRKGVKLKNLKMRKCNIHLISSKFNINKKGTCGGRIKSKDELKRRAFGKKIRYFTYFIILKGEERNLYI